MAVQPSVLSTSLPRVEFFVARLQGSDKTLDVIGTNDGLDWWSVTGRTTGGQTLELDFSQQENCDAQHDIPGCNYTAAYNEDEILFDATGNTCHTVAQGAWEWSKFDGARDAALKGILGDVFV